MILAGTLGFAIIAQVRQTSIEGLENLREDELVRIFAGVDQDGDRLADEIRGLESSLVPVQSTNEAEAERAAQQRLDALGISPAPRRRPARHRAHGERPGGQGHLVGHARHGPRPRDAGAEAIQIGGPGRRRHVVRPSDGGLSVSGTLVRPPYVVRAIGDGNTLAGALEIRYRDLSAAFRREHRHPDRGRGRGGRVADPDPASVRSPRTDHHPLSGPPARARSDMSDLEYPAGLRYTAVRVGPGRRRRLGVASPRSPRRPG